MKAMELKTSGGVASGVQILHFSKLARNDRDIVLKASKIDGHTTMSLMNADFLKDTEIIVNCIVEEPWWAFEELKKRYMEHNIPITNDLMERILINLQAKYRWNTDLTGMTNIVHYARRLGINPFSYWKE